jgi:hypothetical protein
VYFGSANIRKELSAPALNMEATGFPEKFVSHPGYMTSHPRPVIFVYALIVILFPLHWN